MRSREELQAAVESMFRIRAVESPPDAAGARRIWHRGVRGAELVTVVDGKGQVVQQELTLFGELWRWDHRAGFLATELEDEPSSPRRTPDGAEALARLTQAIDGYPGTDRFLVHFKDQLVAHARGAPVAARPSITDGERAPGVAGAPVVRPAARGWVLAAVIGGALLVGVALAALWGR